MTNPKSPQPNKTPVTSAELQAEIASIIAAKGEPLPDNIRLADMSIDTQNIAKAITSKITELEKAAFERGRIAEAKVCEEAKRHDYATKYTAVMEAIGKDEHINTHYQTNGTAILVNEESEIAYTRNQLRAELRQSIAKIFGKEV